MSQTIGRGGTTGSQMDAYWFDGSHSLVNPTNPRVDVINPSDVVVVDDAVPTLVGLGQTRYPYTVPIDAPLGTWRYYWTGIINGAAVNGSETFTVVAAGTVESSDALVVTVGTYRRITLDTTSTDAAITGALTEAQTLVEEYLQRKLTSQQRTETLLLDRSGRVHPSAVPIASVTSPAGATIDRFAISSVDPDESPSLFFWSEPPTWGSWLPRATVTYVGGFTADTLPATIARRIAVEAWAILHPADLSAVAVGATSVSVGDASVTFGPGGAPGELSPVTKATLRRYRRVR